MMDKNKTKAQLIRELEKLRKRIASLESSVTASARSEKILRKSEASYRAVVEDQSELICRFLPDKTLTFVNSAYCRYFALRRDELIGSSFMRLIPESDHEYIESHLASLSIDSPAAMHEHRVIAPNGEIRWQQWTNRAIFDDENRIIEYQSVGRDITDRKRAEEELRQSEERYRLLVETIPHGVQEIDASGTITFVNSAHCKIHGYSAEDLIGESVLDLVAFDSEREKLSGYLTTLVNERPEPVPYVGQDRTKDGKIKDIQVDWDYEKDSQGRVIGFVSVLTDITDRKRAEEQLRQAHDEMEQKVKERTKELLEVNEQLRREIESRKGVEERLRESEVHIKGILNAAPAGIGLVRKRVFDWVSNQMCEMVGYSADELVGQSARIVYEVDEEFARVGEVKYTEIQERGVGSVETRFKHKDGSVLDVLLCSSAVDPGDLSKGVIFTVLDITERKQVEEALRESEEKYRRLVETSIDGIAIVQGTEMKFANKALLDMYGATGPEEVIGRNFSKFVSHEHRDLLVQRGLDRERGKDVPNRYEFKALKLDESEFDVEISVNPISYQGKPARQAFLRDISERKRAEDAMRKSEEKYRLLVDNLPSIVYKGYKDWSVEFFDAKIERLTGYSMKEFNSGRMKWSDLIVEKDNAGARESFIKALKTDKSYVREYRIKAKSGNILWIQERANIICDDKGEIDHVSGVFFDITERKQGENVLKESEQRFRGVLEAVPDLMLVLDAEGCYRDVYTANHDLLYAPVDQLLGKKIHEVLPPEDAQQIQKIIDRVLETEELQIHEYQLETGGMERWFAGRSTKFRFHDTDCVLWCARDITQHKMAEEALRESEERHRNLLEASPDPIVVYDMEGRATYLNPAFEETFGWSAQELLGKNIEFVPEENWPETRKAIARMLRGEKIQSFETRRFTKDGRILDIQLSSSVFHDRDDNTAGNIVILRDVSKRKKAEDALRKREAELAAQSSHLEEVNAALRVLLKQRESDKADLEERLLANVKDLVLPYVEKLKKSRLHSDQMTLVDILESNLKEIVSPFVTKLSSRFLSLTPTEIQVASLIKDGKSSKEIATLTNASENTVRSHRFHIRSKLGIKNKKVNLRSYLQSLQE